MFEFDLLSSLLKETVHTFHRDQRFESKIQQCKEVILFKCKVRFYSSINIIDKNFWESEPSIRRLQSDFLEQSPDNVTGIVGTTHSLP